MIDTFTRRTMTPTEVKEIIRRSTGHVKGSHLTLRRGQGTLEGEEDTLECANETSGGALDTFWDNNSSEGEATPLMDFLVAFIFLRKNA